eukprot:TRINITY_DN843_c0_g3_i3.p2 TRINITY_DN843_c0_g3~~TRINITY_DN843_c0_g3_i3.p2  ORF type:complete len:120 (+),score=26.88 TRINITY_DN843_c0_g3_i3:776-1135(+)
MELMTNREKLDAASQIQDQSILSLDRSKKLVQSANEIGVNTAATLKEQTERLNLISDDLDLVENNLKKANKQIRAFARRVMTDKIILCLLCLIFIGVIFVIVYSIVDPDAKTNKPDSFT